MKPRVLIADDHLLVVEGLFKVIEAECQIVGTASNGRHLVDLAMELRPDIILLDIAMPLLSGMEAARRIKQKAPEIKLIFVTMQSDRNFVREAFDLGASGYLLKHSSASELRSAIADVRGGRYSFSPGLAEGLATSTSYSQNPSDLFSSLTPRQREVLQLVGEGRSAKEIATLLTISVKTVEFHKKRLLQELQLRNTADLIRYAVQQGALAP